MTIQRMDHVGVVVDDLEAAISFFVELGMELADTRLRDLTLLVDERSEVTSRSFVARAGPDDCDASSCEEEGVLDQNAPVRHVLCLTHKSDANRRCDEFRGARPSN